MKKQLKGWVVPIFAAWQNDQNKYSYGDDQPLFDLIIYDVGDEIFHVPILSDNDRRAERQAAQLEQHPVGGGIIRAALKRRGLDPDKFITSPFFIEPLRSYR